MMIILWLTRLSIFMTAQLQSPPKSSFIPQSVALRVVADILIINAAVILAMAIVFLADVSDGAPYPVRDILGEYLTGYLRGAWLLSIVGVTAYAAFGFYTRSRSYRSRYKLILVAQAVSVTFGLFLLVLLIVPTLFKFTWLAPKVVSAYLLAYPITLIGSGAARVWSDLWRLMLARETNPSAESKEKDRDTVERVLVIGGAGYIGSALLRKLLARGYKVRLLDLFMFGKEPLADMVNHENLEIIEADFRQVDKIVQAVRGMDAVVHLGGLVGDPACAVDEDLTIDINLTATRMVAEVAKGSGVKRFVFASTCSVYGASDEVLDERSGLNPVSLYARSKIASEIVLHRLADATFAPTLLRFGTIYGLSGRTRFDLVVNLLTAKAVIDGEITVFGGDQWRPFVHVDDAALSVLKVLEAPFGVVANKTYNVGSNGQNYTIQQAADIIHKLVPAAAMISKGQDGDRRNYRVDFSKIRNELGYDPQWTVEKGVQQVLEALRAGKVSNYKDARYSNVKYLTEYGIEQLAPENSWAKELIAQPPVNPEAEPAR
jgi:nucleoside-diphosphate-sugar epimerase